MMSPEIEKVTGRPSGRFRTKVALLATAVGVGMIAVLPGVMSAAGVDHGISHADASPLAAAPAEKPLTAAPSSIATVLEASARTALGGHANLGVAKDVALDSAFGHVSYDKASAAYVTFGNEKTHAWKVFVGVSDPRSDRPTSCPVSGSVLACSIENTADGGYAVVTVIASKSVQEFGAGRYMELAEGELVDPEHLADYRFEHNVRAIHPDGSMTSVTETVVGPSSTNSEKAFVSPVEDLTALATDPRLVWK